MKKLKVPYLETLDVLDLSSVGFLMEKAQRESIDVINWEEYSYKLSWLSISQDRK